MDVVPLPVTVVTVATTEVAGVAEVPVDEEEGDALQERSYSGLLPRVELMSPKLGEGVSGAASWNVNLCVLGQCLPDKPCKRRTMHIPPSVGRSKKGASDLVPVLLRVSRRGHG